MDKNVMESLYNIMDTIQEALSHWGCAENDELRQMVAGGREQVTAALESELLCSLEHRINISALSDQDWLRTAYLVLAEIEEPFRPANVFDREFQTLLNYIWSHSRHELLEEMKAALRKLEKSSAKVYKGFVDYFARYPLWGPLDPEKGDFTTLEMRADVLKQHSYDFLWLYQRMEDYLSKRTLYAVLKNWAVLDMVELAKVKSIFPDYWEPDIFHDNQDDVLADIGAFNGDSISQYVQTYGQEYKRIYAYEISAGTCRQLKKNVTAMRLHDVIVRQKGAGAETEELFVESNHAAASANHLRQQGKARDRVEVVRLDEDIEEPVTFLKMDIEGAEQSALLGCERIIRSQHPKLAICTYHGYEDIWKIPIMIDSMYPKYQFYMRHYGGNVIPTEFVLLCRP